ncbi:MAG: hypothetical protein V4719_03245 [Planctomycetota bacterium]
MRERIEFTATLINKLGCEDNEVRLSWGVAASAMVMIDGGSRDHQGEMTIEDIRIDEAHSTWLEYPGFGSQIATPNHLESSKVLAWLRSELEEREDWVEVLSRAAERKAISQIGNRHEPAYA